MLDYKSTLNLPQTKFPMKADLPKREPEFLKFWHAIDIYRLIREKLKARSKYILHDGPPYANGDIHIGHALNKTLKDIIVKYKTMRGYNCPYVPGWDCHGLPVEHQLFKELGIDKHQIKRLEFRKKAYDYAQKYVSLQREQFRRLGVFADWQNPYLTLSTDYEASVVVAFADLVKKGYVYHGLKPVNWCFRCETALAEAEVEYEQHTCPSIYVKFKLEEGRDFNKDSYLVIWTTTPWTLMANVAVAVHPDFIYSYLKIDQEFLIIAKDLLPKVLSHLNVTQYEIAKEIKGENLERLTYNHPFDFRRGRVVLADYVSKEEGTGLVHIAPGHGNEDYLTGLKYKLEVITPVDEKGNFDSSIDEFQGLNVYDANYPIIEKLKAKGRLLFNTQIEHAYPHCWRCKSPIIFRATQQWFLNIEHNDLRKRLLKVIKEEIRWIPATGKERIAGMVELRPDWCLSRQRYWGVPIPSLVCNNCGREVLEVIVIEKFARRVLEEGTDCWFKRDIRDFLPEGMVCSYCKRNNFSRGSDILDVWFDSGVSHQAVLKKRKDLEFPCALYLEGSDQHRGWFQSSLIPSICIDGVSPFKSVLTHGFVVDGKGQKMSKSEGNVISPFGIIKDFGSDILRLWVASSDYNDDVRISDEILLRLTEAYRKIRNTIRFILSNLFDFSQPKNKVNYQYLKRIDKWILFRMEVMLKNTLDAYENFEFYRAYKEIYDFCNEDLSMKYLDMIKGRFYTFPADSPERRQAQTTIYEILNVLLRIISPILVFTAEEIWQHMPKEEGSPVSVHLLDWPQGNPVFAQDDLIINGKDIDTELKFVMELIPEVALALEEKRAMGIIGSSFDAQIILLTSDEFRYKYLGSLKDDLTEIYKVSQVNIEMKEQLDTNRISQRYPDVRVVIEKAEGNRCIRCWNYSSSLGESSNHPQLCQRCLEVLERS